MMQEIKKTDQYALVAFLIDQAASAKRELGKKALQKKVHLIQELGGVDTGYRFSFYTYGPYSAGLAGDLDLIAISDGAEICYNNSDNRYQIDAGKLTHQMVNMGEEFITKHQSAIERVLDAFGNRTAKGLELVSTIAYLYRHSPAENFKDDEKLAMHVMHLKPKYGAVEVGKAIDEVKSFLSEIRDTAGHAEGVRT